MPRMDVKQPPTVTVKIVPGESTPAQRHTWEKFWKRIIADAKTPPGAGRAGA
jgi:hypothetical protein